MYTLKSVLDKNVKSIMTEKSKPVFLTVLWWFLKEVFARCVKYVMDLDKDLENIDMVQFNCNAGQLRGTR